MSGPRKSSVFLVLLGGEVLAFLLCLAHARVQRAAAAPSLARVERVVAAVGLTDLALFTEARYTRHLSQADRHAAFQEHPVCLEHFPSGALAVPSRRPSEQLSEKAPTAGLPPEETAWLLERPLDCWSTPDAPHGRQEVHGTLDR